MLQKIFLSPIEQGCGSGCILPGFDFKRKTVSDPTFEKIKSDPYSTFQKNWIRILSFKTTWIRILHNFDQYNQG